MSTLSAFWAQLKHPHFLLSLLLPSAQIAVVVATANYTNVATLKWRRHFTRFECEIYNRNCSQSSPTLTLIRGNGSSFSTRTLCTLFCLFNFCS